MIKLKAKIVEWRPEKIKQQTDKWGVRFLYQVGGFIRRAAQQSMRSKKGTSQPGQPPHAHTKRYRKSVAYDVDRTNQIVVIGPLAAEVGEILEFGGTTLNTGRDNKAYIQARPHIRPALDQGIRDIQSKAKEPLPRMWSR